MDRRPTRNPDPAARRNIFHPPSRRANPHNNINNNNNNNHNSSKNPVHIPAEEPDQPKDELVERDESGNYRIAAPDPRLVSALLNFHDLDEEVEIEQENALIALYPKMGEHGENPALMADIKAALKSSLEREVASFEHDKWMFEGEPKSKG